MKLLKGDCLELMRDIPDKSIDMILCDLPYGTTACKWDVTISFDELWKQYKRIIKNNGAIALFGSEPFSSKLRLSNLKMYKYDWIWEKQQGANFMLVKYQPYKVHEIISIFSKKTTIYNPQMTKGEPYTRRNKSNGSLDLPFKLPKEKNIIKHSDGKRYPRSIQYFKSYKGKEQLHPTQKPVPLLEYLIKTYTNEGMTVLDNCMGSGSTGIACINTNRKFIGIELDDKYFEIAKERIEKFAKEFKVGDNHVL